MIKNDDIYRRIVSNSTNVYRPILTNLGDHDAANVCFFGVNGNNTLPSDPSYIIMGNIFESSPSFALTNNRVIGAVNSNYLSIDTNSNNGVPYGPTDMQRFIGNDSSLNFSQNWIYSARSSPFQTFYTSASTTSNSTPNNLNYQYFNITNTS